MALALVAPMAIAAAERSAHAAVDCATLTPSVYITGSTASQPFLAALGTALSASATPLTIIYKGVGSCVGVDAALNGTLVTGTANYWDATGTLQTCNIATGVPATIGVSDIFATTCPGVTTVPATIGDFFGPNQVMEMVVPKASLQTSISAEAAYLVFAVGPNANGQVDPWNDKTNIFIRSTTSGTEQMIAHAITAPASFWANHGTGEASSGAVLSALVAPTTNAQAAIGILVAGDADANRATVTTLAFQDFKKSCAYWPDSAPTLHDKLNVRNGNYPIWGPLHFLTTVDAAKKPTDANAAKVLGYLTGTTPPPAGVNLLDLEIKAYTVPSCAMSVQRSTEIGPLTPFTPPASCNCYYDKGENGTTTCDACTMDTDCKKPGATHCRLGYCEAT
jgi:ABC-type phosphate transport system substrate-binding protein